MEDMSCQQPSAPRICHPYFSQQYCYENREIVEDPESFIDAISYSESDGYINVPMVRAVPSHDIQELYFRKPMITPSQISSAPKHSRCCLSGHCPVPTEYIYEYKPRAPPHLSVAQSVFTAQGIPRRSSSAYATPPKTLYLNNPIEKDASTSQRVNYAESPNFRSTSALPITIARTNSSKPGHASIEDKRPGIKRYPVMYRAARYLRRPLQPVPLKTPEILLHKLDKNLPKRLPRPVIPPGVSKSQEIKPSQEALRSDTKLERSTDDINLRKMNSEGDTAQFDTNIDSMDTIERIVATLDENESDELSDDHKKEIRKMSKFLVPRVPNSVKEIQQKGKKDTDMNPGNSIDKQEVSDKTIPGQKKASQVSFKESLDNILDQLENCELSLNTVRSKYSANHTGGRESSIKEKTKEEEIFNLREISEKISKPSSTEKWNKKTTQKIDPTIHSKQSENTEESTVKENSSMTIRATGPRGCLDDVAAIELHRSKSYIVNLIDRALSKELGTIPNERMERGLFQGLTPTMAINHINRNCRVENEMLDGARGMNGNIVNCITNPESKLSDSSLSNEGEPAYIRQLKELRWGHFKHIQQEVKRLEDLERFLDKCSSPCGSSY